MDGHTDSWIPSAAVPNRAGYGAPMALAPGTYKIGPDTGHLHIRTAREGVAAKAGHDLLIAFARWSGTVAIGGDDPKSAQVDVDVEMDSFDVLEGTGGVVALTDHDRQDITATARKLLDVDRHAQASFASNRVTAGDTGATIDGTLTLRGTSGPVTVDVAETGPSAWRGTATVLQSAFGIKPYRAFFGALRLADPVGVEVTVDLSGK